MGDVRSIAIKNIVSPQETVSPEKVASYKDKQGRDDEDGIGIKYKDKVYLVDGNHRVSARLESGKTYANIRIINKDLRAMNGRLTQLTVAASGYKTRTETFDGREHLVVPVVALVEGVVHAMNAKNAEFVAASEFSRAPGGWNGRPLFFGHPLNKKGAPVSGNSPDVLEAKSIGRIFNSAIRSGKLAMEAWIDVEKAKEVAPEVLERVEAGETVEISVGVFVETDDVEGEYQGKKYLGEWHDIVPDHLALLPKTDEGACSVEMGCGVRAAKKQEAVVSEEKKTERKPSMLGKFLQMFRAAQPANEMSNSDLTRKLYDALRESVGGKLMNVEAFVPVTDPNRVVYTCYEQSSAIGPESCMGYQYVMYERQFTLDANGIVTLNDAVVEVEPVLSYEPVLMAEEVAEGEPMAAKGARNSKADAEKIQAMHDHSVALGAYCDPKMAAAPKTASGAPCSCGGHGGAPTNNSQEERNMTKEQIAKFLETATEDQIKALSVAAGEKPAEQPAAVAAPAAAVVAQPAAVEVKEPTLEDLIAKSSPEVQAAHAASVKASGDAKAATIKSLKDTGRCTIADKDLEAKSQAELDQLLALSGAPKAVAVDFGGQGAPKVAGAGDEKNTVPAPPNMNERILAKGKK